MYYVFFHATATPESYTHCPTLSLPDALPIYLRDDPPVLVVAPLSGHHATLLRDTVKTLLRDHKVYVTDWVDARMVPTSEGSRSEEHTYELQSLMRISYAVFCLQKKTQTIVSQTIRNQTNIQER